VEKKLAPLGGGQPPTDVDHFDVNISDYFSVFAGMLLMEGTGLS
jgi:hypothetical protein